MNIFELRSLLPISILEDGLTAPTIAGTRTCFTHARYCGGYDNVANSGKRQTYVLKLKTTSDDID